jgi:predicted transposase YdaD
MEESVTYQAIIRKGEQRGELRGAIQELRKTLLRQSAIRFGPPSEQVRASIEGTNDLGRLESLSERLLLVNDWAALLEAHQAP